MLHAAIHLSSLAQPRVSFRTTLHAYSSTRGGRTYLPIEFSVRCVISVLPSVFEHPFSLPTVAQDCQRMLLTHLFPLSSPPEDYPVDLGKATLGNYAERKGAGDNTVV